MLRSILVRASSSTSSRNTTSPLRVFMPRTRPKGTCWHLKTEETLSSNKKYKCKQTIATCLPRNVPKCAKAGTAGWSGSTGFCPSWKEIKSNINVILARKIYVWMRSQISGWAVGIYPVDVSYRFTHHINHLIKTVFVHPVDGCSNISEMG